jgi:oligopeptide transport system ATP-binding protein
MKLENVEKYFRVREGVLGHSWIRAVDGVNLEIPRGGSFALVGESGCGKSTLAKLCIGLYPPTKGTVSFDGRDMVTMKGRERKGLRQNIQIVLQNPFMSLDPRMTILSIVSEPMAVHDLARGVEMRNRAEELLKKVGLGPEYLNRYPHEFSGGQRQRIALARALATSPRLLILDEPTSALDVSVQAQILNLLAELKSQFGLTYLLISHDLSVVRHVSDTIGVMYLGQIVELGSNDQIFGNAKHPYTQALLASVPEVDFGTKRQKVTITGDVPSAINPPNACRFNPRCPFAFEKCKVDDPVLLEVEPGHYVSCHLYPSKL